MKALTFEEAMAQNGVLVIAPQGTSMRPSLHSDRDHVVIEGGRLPRKYDVAAYRGTDGQTILHRVVGVSESGFDFLGDNTFVRERQIRPQQIIGVMTGFYRGRRYISCNGAAYRAFSRIWCVTYPLRRLARAFRIKASSFFRGQTKTLPNKTD